MKFKKLACTTLAGLMAVSMTVPAFAATISDIGGLSDIGLDISGSTEVPTISVTVPTTGSVITNPYKLSVDVSAANDGSDLTTDQIISATQFIESESNVPLNLSVTATGEIPTESKAVFSTASVANNAKLTNKSLFLYLQLKAATASLDASGNVETAAPDFQAFDAKTDIVIGAKQVTKPNILTLDAARKEQSGGADVTVPAVAGFRLAGDAVTTPTEAWTNKDIVNVKLAFTFTPTATTVTTP